MSGHKRKDPPEQLYADSRRASGKRFRRQRDPNSWSTSILTIRANVLCLGMSYPSVEKALQKKPNVQIQHIEPSVEQAVELVRRNVLEVIDGRDYARIAALEASNEILAYTVSKEQAGPYELKRHLHADFCSRTFLDQMKRLWGVGLGRQTIKFKQVILDYFWIPPGTWASNHWKQPFFRDRLPEMVNEGMLDYGDLEKDTRLVHVSKSHSGGEYVTSDAGVIYLPFCENCLVEVVSCIKQLSDVFVITFMTKHELDEHTLWKATNTIDAESMQDWLGKKLDQEEEYCKVTRQKLAHGSASTTGRDPGPVLDVFDRIENVEETRMIKLTALRCRHPDFKDDSCSPWPTGLLGVKKGGFAGLLRTSRSLIKAKASPSVPKTDSSIKQSPACEQPIGKVPRTRNRGSVESIVNGSELVLHIKNTTYKEIMHYIFRMMKSGTGKNKPGQKALDMLKQEAKTRKRRNGQLFIYDQCNRKINPVSDEEALKVILNCIKCRRQSYKEWAIQPPTPSRATRSNAKQITIVGDKGVDVSISTKNATATCPSAKRGQSVKMDNSHNKQPKDKANESIKVTANAEPIEVTQSFDETIHGHFIAECRNNITDDNISDLSEPASHADSDLASREVAEASTNLDCKIGASTTTGGADSDMASCKVTESSMQTPSQPESESARPVQLAFNEANANARATETTTSSACRSLKVGAMSSIEAQPSLQPSLAHRFDNSMVQAESVGFHFNRSTAATFPLVNLNQLMVNIYLRNIQAGVPQPSMLDFQHLSAIHAEVLHIQLGLELTETLMCSPNFQQIGPLERQNILSHFNAIWRVLQNNSCG